MRRRRCSYAASRSSRSLTTRRRSSGCFADNLVPSAVIDADGDGAVDLVFTSTDGDVLVALHRGGVMAGGLDKLCRTDVVAKDPARAAELRHLAANPPKKR